MILTKKNFYVFFAIISLVSLFLIIPLYNKLDEFNSKFVFFILISLVLFFLSISLYFLQFESKKRNKIEKILLYLLFVLIALNLVFKINKIPGLGILFTASIIYFSFCYFPLLVKRRVEKWKNDGNKKWLANFMALSDLISYSFISIGFLFKVMEWPGASILILAGVFVLLFSFMGWTKRRIDKRKIYVSKKWQAVVLALADLMSYSLLALGLLARMLHWPFSQGLLIAGFIILIVSFFGWTQMLDAEIIKRKKAEDDLIETNNQLQNKNSIILNQKSDIEKSFKNIELLNTISSEITSSLNLKSVMDLIFKNLSSLMDISFFFISTYNKNDNTTEIKYCVKEGKEVEEKFKTQINNPSSFTALTIKNKQAIIINDLKNEYSKYLNEEPKLHGKEDLWCESLILIPLFIKGEVIGLFSVQSEKSFSFNNSNIFMLKSLASVIAVALNNADSYLQIANANEIVQNQKKLVEQKNTEITDSIEYAKRIQATILPTPKIVKKYLDDSFILYLPKDIVAGDFYWMETNGDWVLFAACDCTGHGVPGALVSVVCHNALNRAVKEYGKIYPNEILDKVAELVLENFSNDDDVKDGMDASVCALNTATGELYWSGANNPLWLIKNHELIEYKADKQPIGKFDDRLPYTKNKIEITKGDTMYLFTDGYADQFGGEKGKKLTKAKFKEKLVSIHTKPLSEQREELFTFLESYKGKLEQVDDICVIAVKV